MSWRTRHGMTLVELTISIAILSLIALAAAALLSICLQAQTFGVAKSSLHQEGTLAMERMVQQIQMTSRVLVPNGQTPDRLQLVVSAGLNNDNDFYFDDPLFPRIDEDQDDDNDGDGAAGVKSLDDDGDSAVDEGNTEDNDEDGLSAEDPLNALDDDGDMSIDEDYAADTNGDGAPGIAAMDDDGDGAIDEGDGGDDDEDGELGEDGLDPVIYSYDSNAGTLSEKVASGAPVVLASRVESFQALYIAPDATHDARVALSLTLADADGARVSFTEEVYPRNTLQKWGRRVR